VPTNINITAYAGEIKRILNIRYDHGPSIKDPSKPKVFKAGLMNNKVDDPVTPKTQKRTPAST